MLPSRQPSPARLWRLPLAQALLLTGCASPGPPRPPSLHLPERVKDLTAERIGDRVHLAWTTPQQTTDGESVTGSLTALLCREILAKAVHPPADSLAACPAALPVAVSPGPSSFDDLLPGDLHSGPPRLLTYRIEVRNAAGRSAGSSPAVETLAGQTVAPAGSLALSSERDGILVRWAPSTSGESMELTRTVQAAANAASGKPAVSPLAPGRPAAQVRLTADSAAADAGGMLDRTARYGDRYTYLGERVRRVTLAGKVLAMRGEPSPPATLLYLDVTPPPAPAGLVAIPIGDPESGSPAAIDLAWQVSTDTDVSGYLVYRSDAGGAFHRATAQPVQVPAWRDMQVVAGERYRYRVTAVDRSGNESAPGTVMEQAAPR